MRFLRFSGALLLWTLASPAAGQGQGEVVFGDATAASPAEIVFLPAALAPSSSAVGPVRARREWSGLPREITPEVAPRVTALPAPPAALARWRWYSTWGVAIGGAVGLAYGLATDDDSAFLDLSPVIEMVIGAGIGFFAGTAVYLVDSAR